MVGYYFLRFLLNFQCPNEIRLIQRKSKSRGIIKRRLMTSYMIDPNQIF